jgi:hypothetical protein
LRPGEGPLTEATADAQRWPRELVFMPLSCRWRPVLRKAEMVGRGHRPLSLASVSILLSPQALCAASAGPAPLRVSSRQQISGREAWLPSKHVRAGEMASSKSAALARPTGGSSRFVTRPFCELGPASTDQVLGVIGRHFDRAVRADVDVPAREGLHSPHTGRRLQLPVGWSRRANTTRPTAAQSSSPPEEVEILLRGADPVQFRAGNRRSRENPDCRAA